MIDLAAAYNKGAIAWAVVLLLPSSWRLRRWEQALCMMVVWLESLLLDRFRSSTMLAHVLVLGLLLIRRHRPFRQSAAGAVRAVFIAWGFTMVVGSAMALIAPGWYGTAAFACGTSTLLLFLSMVWRGVEKTAERETAEKIKAYQLFLQLTIMAYFSFVLPYAVPVQDAALTAVLILSFLGLLAAMYTIMNKMNALALDYQRMRMEEREIERRCTRTFEMWHYIRKLFYLFGEDLAKKDLEGAARHFETEIKPAFAALHGDMEEVKLPSATMAKLVNLALRQVQAMTYVVCDVQIQEDVLLSEENKLRQILNIWLDNAVTALQAQETGFFRLQIKMIEGKKLLVHVANSIEEDERSYYEMLQNNDSDRGFGLQLVHKIIRATPTMAHDGYISRVVDYHKPLFVQQLVVG